MQFLNDIIKSKPGFKPAQNFDKNFKFIKFLSCFKAMSWFNDVFSKLHPMRIAIFWRHVKKWHVIYRNISCYFWPMPIIKKEHVIYRNVSCYWRRGIDVPYGLISALRSSDKCMYFYSIILYYFIFITTNFSLSAAFM